MRKLCSVLLTLGLGICSILLYSENVYAYTDEYYVDIQSKAIRIDPSFGAYQQLVDKNLYEELDKYCDNIFDSYTNDTIVLQKAKEYVNPCMAFATTWGEAGQAYAGISMTTIMDFNPDTYVDDIDWISVTSNLEQVDEYWYLVNTKENYNTNRDGQAYHMPASLLQYPSSGSRVTSAMTGLGVGPYQITSSDWDKWTLTERVSPIEGFQASMVKVGNSWVNSGIEPISDLTIYAMLSLGHQGGGLIDMDFGKQLINKMNEQKVQEAFNYAGHLMYTDLLEKAQDKSVSLSNIDLVYYLNIVEEETGIDFSKYTGGVGSTNKGNYVALHCLRYVFYKNYFTSNS